MLPRTPVNSPGHAFQRAIDQAETLAASGHVSEAIALLEEAEGKAKAAADSLSEGAVALSLAAAQKMAGDEQKAQAALYRAIAAYRAANDPADVAIAFAEVGLLSEYGQQGARLLDAIAEYRNAAENFEKAGYYEEAGFARVKMGQMWQRRGRFLPAIAAYTKAIELSMQQGGRRRPNCYGHCETFGLAYAALASAYASAGHDAFARYLLDLNTLILTVEQAPLTHAAAHNAYAALDTKVGAFEDALRRAEAGLEGARRVGERRLEAELLFRRGIAKAWLRRPGALDDFTAAGNTANELHDEHLKALLLLQLAQLTRDPQPAKSILRQAIARFKAFPDSEPAIAAMALYGEQCAQLGELGEAEMALELAASRAEEVAGDFPKLTAMRMNYYRQHQTIFNGLIEVYLRKNDLASAHWWIQTKKARGILDASSLNSSPLLPHLSPAERQALVGNQRDIARYSRQELAARLTGTANAMAHVWLGIREMELDAYVNSLYAKYGDTTPSFPTPLADLAYLPRVLPEDTALLEYASLDSGLGHRTVLLVATVDNGKLHLQSYALSDKDGKPMSTPKLSELARGFHTACTIPAAAVKTAASELYEVLIAPAADQIKGKQRLVICPDGPLWEVPFQALIDPDGNYLVEHHEVDYAYSGSTFAASMHRPASARSPETRSILVVADPTYGTRQRFAQDLTEEARQREHGAGDGAWIKPLRGTLVEADRIKNAFPQAQILSQEKAQESAIRKQISAYDYVHFATHAVVFDDEPFMSALVLAAPDGQEAQDGLLTARELMDMTLTADMVVLSACNTGEGQRRDSEGIVGLGWALFVAGSPTQVLTQWQASDATTAELMGDFYAQLKRGQPKGAALREAARKMLHHPRTSHPYYWAPFFLMGDYR